MGYSRWIGLRDYGGDADSEVSLFLVVLSMVGRGDGCRMPCCANKFRRGLLFSLSLFASLFMAEADGWVHDLYCHDKMMVAELFGK